MDGIVRKVTFRVRHDCPLARLSESVGELRVWSGHRLELVSVGRGKRPAAEVLAAIRNHLQPERIEEVADGWMALWRPDVDPKSSISRTLERHGMMWSQPLRVAGGWEHYDALGFGAGEQAALDELRRDHPTQVSRRQDLDADAVAATLFMSMGPALDAPTPKQAEALAAAHAGGYYQSPRAATTAELAARLGITRSSFEERLRNGENRIMAEVVPALRWHRTLPSGA